MVVKLCEKQGDKYHCYSPSCYSTYPVTGDKVFCIVCHYCSEKYLLGLAKKEDDAFFLAGFHNWKEVHEKSNTHALSDTHKEAVLKIELSKLESVHALMSK